MTLDERREHERSKYLALRATRYGSTNHGKRAYRLLPTRWRLLIDMGCGDNSFVRGLPTNSDPAIGVDFANEGADIKAGMHAVPLNSGVADVITAFDSLEHLLPEELDDVFNEFLRLAPGGHFIFSISHRPSRITVNGENLHPTVMSRDEWLRFISKYGSVSINHGYFTGKFNGSQQ